MKKTIKERKIQRTDIIKEEVVYISAAEIISLVKKHYCVYGWAEWDIDSQTSIIPTHDGVGKPKITHFVKGIHFINKIKNDDTNRNS